MLSLNYILSVYEFYHMEINEVKSIGVEYCTIHHEINNLIMVNRGMN